MNCSPSLTKQFFMMDTFPSLDHTLLHEAHSLPHFKVQGFYIPIRHIPVGCWLTHHWSGLSWSVVFLLNASSGMWLGWQVCFCHYSYCCGSCLYCCLHFIRICHSVGIQILLSFKFVWFQSLSALKFWSA